MHVVVSDVQARHAPRFFLVRGTPQPSPETPARADALLAAARAAGHRPLAPRAHGAAPRARVHTPAYLHFLEHVWREWQALPGASEEVLANVHPARRPASYPRSLVGRAGWHMADTACPIGEGTFEAACAAADCALEAAERVLTGEPVCYALCRPPGHHAFADMAGGFCFLNNTAIAAQHLLARHARVAVLDIDVHHGNGTQAIFYRRADVLTISLHADPSDFYPFFWGHAHERGEADGEGFNLNLPLPVGTGDDDWLAALERALAMLEAFAPGALVVALGLDAHEDDPLAGMTLTRGGFARIAARIATLGLPSVLVQEGGYAQPALGPNLAAFLDAFEAAQRLRD